MEKTAKIFKNNAVEKGFDRTHRKIINFNISKYNAAVPKGKSQFNHLDIAKSRAAQLKFEVASNLDRYLETFEKKFEENGGNLLWAIDEKEAIQHVLAILKSENAKKIVKSKSMITEEIELNEALEKDGIETVETDLGEYIVQIAGEKPYHIITPVMHKSKEIIAELFHEKFGTKKDSTPEELTKFVRGILREKFINSDAGITGANFLVAKEGAIALTENEGNGLMTMSLPKVHIVIAGIDKMIPSVKDMYLYWPLLSSHGTGQNVTVYNSLIFGPKNGEESDGPEKLYLILVDNGRSHLLKQVPQRRAFTCIRCGACLNGCPVYKNIGGHSYNTVYSGPIGSVITPFLKVFPQYKHLSYASSLCGKCSEVCPVNINLHELLLENRYYAVRKKYTPKSERVGIYFWKVLMNRRWTMDFVGGHMKNIFFNMAFKKLWGPRRELPVFAKNSFKKQWQKQSKS